MLNVCVEESGNVMYCSGSESLRSVTSVCEIVFPTFCPCMCIRTCAHERTGFDNLDPVMENVLQVPVKGFLCANARDACSSHIPRVSCFRVYR